MEKSDFSIGHRGAPLQFPEHTRESYVAAAQMGAGTAADVRRVGQFTVGIKLGRYGALVGQIRFEDVGGGVQVTLRVTADQLAVFGEGDITLENASTHLSGGHTYKTLLLSLFALFFSGLLSADVIHVHTGQPGNDPSRTTR